MFINKIGYEHIQNGTNNHDWGFENAELKCVMDGCSEGKHSEVGAKLFGHLFSKGKSLNDCFDILFNLFPKYEEIKNHMLFTVLYLSEDEDNYIVNICGDGYIIKQKYDDFVEYEKIGEGNSPEYFAYNYVSPDYLSKYKDGVVFKQYILPKNNYKAIGLSSDGLDYILNSPFKDEFEDYLLRRKEFAIRRLINREYKYFKDDISIVI